MGPRMTYNQIWANTDQVAVTKNTRKCLIFLTSSSGMTYWQKPMIINRLKAADPTIVPGPRSPALKFLAQISMTDHMISGADEPSAIKVRLATVSFHTLTMMTWVLPVRRSFTDTSFSWAVIISMDSMNLSEAIATPMNRYTIRTAYSKPRPNLSPKLILSVPGHRGISSPSSQLMPELSLAGTAAASEPLAVANIQAATRQARPAWRTVAAI